jgi:hypothetical protein
VDHDDLHAPPPDPDDDCGKLTAAWFFPAQVGFKPEVDT